MDFLFNTNTYFIKLRGLRIKFIKNYDNNGSFLEGKEYRYGKNQDGLGNYNGLAEHKPQIFLQYTPPIKDVPSTIPLVLNYVKHNVYAMYSYLPKSSPYGNLISYENVYEYIIDNNNQNSGFIHYKYSYTPDGLVSTNTRPPYYYSDNSVKRGNLLAKTTYNDKNEIVKKELFKYSITQKSPDPQRKYNFFVEPKIYPFPGYLNTLSFDKLYNWGWLIKLYYQKNLIAKTTITYCGTDSIVETKTFSYRGSGKINKLSDILTINSNGEFVKITYEYPFSYQDSVQSEMVSRNFYPLIGEKVVYNNEIKTYKKLIYKKFGDIFLPAVLKEKLKENINYNQAETIYITDGLNNPVYVKSKSNTEIIYLWSYNGQYPIAEIKNKTFDEIENILGKGTLLNMSSTYYTSEQINALIKKITGQTGAAAIKTYTFPDLLLDTDQENNKIKQYVQYAANGKPIHIITKDNQNIVYLWGTEGKYPMLEIKNKTYEEVEKSAGTYLIESLYKSGIVTSELRQRLSNDIPSSDITQYTYPDILVNSTTETLFCNATEYLKYDTYGNPLCIKNKDGSTNVLLWCYNGKYPLAKIQNTSWEEVINIIGSETVLLNLSGKAVPSESDLSLINKLRSSLKNSSIQSFTYKPLVGIISSTDQRGITTYYEYDSSNRLKKTYLFENGEKKILESYNYKYAN